MNLRSPTLRVFLIDRQDEIRSLVANHLSLVDRVQVVGSGRDVAAVTDSIWQHRPQVVVLDQLPGDSWSSQFFDAARRGGTGLVLHCSLPPLVSSDVLIRAGINEVIFKEVGQLDQLSAAILRAAPDC